MSSSRQSQLRRLMKLEREKKKENNRTINNQHNTGIEQEEDPTRSHAPSTNLKGILKPSSHPHPRGEIDDGGCADIITTNTTTYTVTAEGKDEGGSLSVSGSDGNNALAGLMMDYGDSDSDSDSDGDKMSSEMEAQTNEQNIKENVVFVQGSENVNKAHENNNSKRRVAFGGVETKMIPMREKGTSTVDEKENTSRNFGESTMAERHTFQSTLEGKESTLSPNIPGMVKDVSISKESKEVSNDVDDATMQEFEDLLNDDVEVEVEPNLEEDGRRTEERKIPNDSSNDKGEKKRKKKKKKKKKIKSENDAEKTEEFTSEVEQVAYEARLAKLMLMKSNLGRASHKDSENGKESPNGRDNKGFVSNSNISVDFMPALAFHNMDDGNKNEIDFESNTREEENEAGQGIDDPSSEIAKASESNLKGLKRKNAETNKSENPSLSVKEILKLKRRKAKKLSNS
eukprot:CAMPEP_0184866832 /NCGR_PEP_ID=MMETSP0580-20130426/23930_1 /TAXON_ID=1118495 /ORGANISM="Dactyliosolen fragilissimus" /LENGTH=456 /DNA_ID=CAMNT_0027366729 /DNA_START=140 /DNA_END=1506 /DNA_ORIENTATION=+